MKSKYKVIGLMSGTSLDGLDIAHCVFQKYSSGWKYSLSSCETIKYTAHWISRLSNAHLLTGEELIALDAAYGEFLGKASRDFMRRHQLKTDFIASHGHTVFHRPRQGFTYQIGNGYALNSVSSLPVVCDFRRQDVAWGGEGAPLVPAGDKFLFSDYDVCLNLGGIANLSAEVKGKRLAFDICFCNMGLNYLAMLRSKKFDKGGAMAAQGTINPSLLKALNKIYAMLETKRPSLGREIFESRIKPLLDSVDIPLEDRLSTFTESAALEITRAIFSCKKQANVLCTGGGAFNSYLISRMLHYGGDALTFVIPEDDVVKFKEALIFGFLGVLRVRNEINCLKTVTHSTTDSSAGTMIGF